MAKKRKIEYKNKYEEEIAKIRKQMRIVLIIGIILIILGIILQFVGSPEEFHRIGNLCSIGGFLLTVVFIFFNTTEKTINQRFNKMEETMDKGFNEIRQGLSEIVNLLKNLQKKL